MQTPARICSRQDLHIPHCLTCESQASVLTYVDQTPPQPTIQVVAVCPNYCGPFVCNGNTIDPTGSHPNFLSEEMTKLIAQKTEQAEKEFNTCLFDLSCTEPTIKAHAASRKWLKIFGNNKVLIFKPYMPNLTSSPNSVQIPHPVGRRKATTGHFCCHPHDKRFNPIDDPPEHLSDQHLKLLFHRAVLRTVYNRSLQLSAYQNPIIYAVRYQIGETTHVPSLVRDHLLAKARQTLQHLPENDPTDGGKIRHKVFFIPGTPKVAVSNASIRHHDIIGYNQDGTSEHITTVYAVAAISVVPRHNGHTVIYHWITMEDDPLRAKYSNRFIQDQMDTISRFSPAQLEKRISEEILSIAEDICISKPHWQSLSPEEKQSIASLWKSQSAYYDTQSPPTGEINLFN